MTNRHLDELPTAIHLGQYWPDRNAEATIDEPHDPHYRVLREHHERGLDEDYRAWRRHRFASDFETWRQARRGGAEHPTDPQALRGKASAPPSEDTDLFFERS